MVETRLRPMILTHPSLTPELSPLRRPSADASPEARAARRSAGLRRARQERADVATMATLIVCATLVCLLGAIWLASYARLNWQASEMHQVEQSLTQAEERHEALTQKVASLQSEKRIRFLAAGMKMVPGGASHYLTPEAAPPRYAAQVPPPASLQRVADAQ